jgi:hypothetical protein
MNDRLKVSQTYDITSQSSYMLRVASYTLRNFTDRP